MNLSTLTKSQLKMIESHLIPGSSLIECKDVRGVVAWVRIKNPDGTILSLEIGKKGKVFTKEFGI
jgi:hypothetical protein